MNRDRGRHPLSLSRGKIRFTSAVLLKSNRLLARSQKQIAPAALLAYGLCGNSWVAKDWWSWTGSNRRPPACKAGALPTELQPPGLPLKVVGLDGFEPSTPALSRRCSNQLSYRPACQLTLGQQPIRVGSGIAGWRSIEHGFRERR